MPCCCSGWIIVAGPEGFAESATEALAGLPILQLKPWGRIAGRLAGAPGAAGGERVSLILGNLEEGMLQTDSQQVTDPNGGFTFEKVPPGKRRVARVIVERWLRKRGGHVSEDQFLDAHGEPRWLYPPSMCQVH